MTLCRDHKYIMSSVIAYYKLKHWPEFLRWSKTLFISQYKIYWLLYRELQFIRTQRRILLPNSLLSPLFFKLWHADICSHNLATLCSDALWPNVTSAGQYFYHNNILSFVSLWDEATSYGRPLLQGHSLSCQRALLITGWRFITVSQRVITAGRSDCCYSSWSQCCSFCLQFLCLL